MRKSILAIAMLALLLMPFGVMAQDGMEVRFQCYQDGNECDVYADLLDGFMEENPDITVIVEEVPYQFILDSLPVNVEVD
ncbi:MAG: carbohydrate ABC transporter substrate-binding protein, partial [Aggregatilineales bacterium]